MADEEMIVPTNFTRAARTVSVVGAALWLAVAATYWVAQSVDDDWVVLYTVWTAGILSAGVLTFVASLGLRERHGGFRVLGTIGLVIFGLGVASSFISWAIPLWMTIQGVGMLLIALAMRPARVPAFALVAYGSGMLVGVGTFVALTALKVGTPDRWGDYPLAWSAGITVGLVLVAAGLLGIGIRLQGETTTDVNPSTQTATT